MGKIKFAFGIHCHQPVGNFDFVFEEAYHKAYQPFLDVIQKYPDFKINIHYTGILLKWIKKHFPEHITQLKEMTSRGQVEIMSGGFYEPILSVVPQKDGIGQIQKLSEWILREFGQQPRGMWLAERVWEPTLPTIMRKAGIEYTVIDDAHFRYSGLENKDLSGYYITEDSGSSVNIFPISQKLRYTIPFQNPVVTIEYLREFAADREDCLIVFADDGEKFGVWPGTYKHVFKNKWLEQFLQEICENLAWIEMVHFSEMIDKMKPIGRIYLPTASYAEMMQWTLFPKAFQKYEEFEHYLKEHHIYDKFGVFVRGGFWRNFMAKYPEANQMHKKMLYVSSQIWKAKEFKDDPILDKALDHLWAGQCNCPYWHGVFGGLYLGHLRHAVYRKILEAEKLLRKANKREQSSALLEFDYNSDGYDEIILETPQLNLYLEPARGGRITELDYLPKNFNLLNTLTRHEEGYHQKLLISQNQAKTNSNTRYDDSIASIHDLISSKEEGLEKYLNYDFYERKSLIDHFFRQGTTLTDFQAARYEELGDFALGEYRTIRKENDSNFLRVVLEREGNIQSGHEKIPLTVTKIIELNKKTPQINIYYKLNSYNQTKLPVWFGVEFNFSLLAGYADDRYYFSNNATIQPKNLASSGEISDIQHLGLVDEYNDIQIDLMSDQKARVWRCPVETISQSEAGFERVYQSSAVVFSFKLKND